MFFFSPCRQVSKQNHALGCKPLPHPFRLILHYHPVTRQFKVCNADVVESAAHKQIRVGASISEEPETSVSRTLAPSVLQAVRLQT